VDYHYDASGQRTATQLFSQGNEVVTTSHAYDGMGRLTQIRHGDIAQYDFSWDAADRITSMNDAVYGYDATSQLISAVYGFPGGTKARDGGKQGHFTTPFCESPRLRGRTNRHNRLCYNSLCKNKLR